MTHQIIATIKDSRVTVATEVRRGPAGSLAIIGVSPGIYENATIEIGTNGSVVAISPGVSQGYFVQPFADALNVSVPHNFGKYPSVIILNQAGDRIYGQEVHQSLNTVIVSFNIPVSGTIICK